jgi:hypothetical protein
MTAGGIGITLTAAAHVFFAELHWTPGVLMQAEDRAHRIGQTETVNVHYLVARDTLDEKMWRMIVNKVDVVSNALQGRGEKLSVALERSDSLASASASSQREGADRSDGRDSDDDGEGRSEAIAPAQPHAFGDLRSFFARGAQGGAQLRKKKKSATASAAASSDVVDLSGSSAASPLRRTWSCGKCTLHNKWGWLRCDACGTPRPPQSKSKSALAALSQTPKAASPSASQPGSARSARDASSGASQQPAPKAPKAKAKRSLFFSVSEYSGRVYVYDSAKKFCKQSFTQAALAKAKAAESAAAAALRRAELPRILHADAAFNEACDFLSKWAMLRGVERAELCARPVRPPLMAEYRRAKSARMLRAKAARGGAGTISFARYSAPPQRGAAAAERPRSSVCRSVSSFLLFASSHSCFLEEVPIHSFVCSL